MKRSKNVGQDPRQRLGEGRVRAAGSEVTKENRPPRPQDKVGTSRAWPRFRHFRLVNNRSPEVLLPHTSGSSTLNGINPPGWDRKLDEIKFRLEGVTSEVLVT